MTLPNTSTATRKSSRRIISSLSGNSAEFLSSATPTKPSSDSRPRFPCSGSSMRSHFRELIIESEISVAYRDGPEYARRAAQSRRANRQSSPPGRQPARHAHHARGRSDLRARRVRHFPFLPIVNGAVTLQALDNSLPSTQLGAGEFFGEMSLLSGRPRTERAIAGPACVLVETPRANHGQS